MKISEKVRIRVMSGEPACICVAPEYFEDGDYSGWQNQSEETATMTYEEYLEWLVNDMREKYDSIVVYSDGCIYGNKGGISHDISYNDFRDVETFLKLAEEYGIGEIQFQ